MRWPSFLLLLFGTTRILLFSLPHNPTPILFMLHTLLFVSIRCNGRTGGATWQGENKLFMRAGRLLFLLPRQWLMKVKKILVLLAPSQCYSFITCTQLYLLSHSVRKCPEQPEAAYSFAVYIFLYERFTISSMAKGEKRGTFFTSTFSTIINKIPNQS